MSFFSQDKILQVMFALNPWWSTGKVKADMAKPFKRTVYYDSEKILSHKTIRRAIVISGARRVGKTTIIYQHIDAALARGIAPKKILYISFDHPLLKMCDISQLVELFINNVARIDSDLDSENALLFFDEIQYATDWDKWLKILYDQNPKYKIMATGSVMTSSTSRVTESGVWPWTEIKLSTLSFYEYVSLIGVEPILIQKKFDIMQTNSISAHELTETVSKLQSLHKLFNAYLLMGGFPEIALSNDLQLAQKVIIEDIVDKVIKRDVMSLFNIRNISEFEKVFLYLCMTNGNVVVTDSMAKQVGVARATISLYLDLLQRANLVYTSKQLSLAEQKVIKMKPKIYLADPIISNAILMLGEEVLANSKAMGLIVESALYRHLHTYYSGTQASIGYYREQKTHKKIDIVVKQPTAQALIEVKYHNNTSLSEKEAIVKLADYQQTKAAIVVTRAMEDHGFTNHLTNTKILRIPAFALIYLLGVPSSSKN